MKDNIKDIYSKLPSSWEELKLKDFIKIGNVQIIEQDEFEGQTVGIENTLSVISVLTDTTVSELEELSMLDLGLLGDRLAFMGTSPVPNKTGKFKWKQIDEITYNDFITYQALSGDMNNNIALIIQAFAKDKLNEEEILNLPMSDIVTGFFLQRKIAKKFIHSMIRTSKHQLNQQKLKEAHIKKN